LDPEPDVLRKEVDEIFGFLLREGASLGAFASTPAPVISLLSLSLFQVSSESDTGMAIGIEVGTFSIPFAIERAPVLVEPTFFFLATGCSPGFFPLALVRELARELAPPLEELVIAMLWIGGLLLVLVEWVLGNSRVPRTFPGIVKVASTSGMGKRGETAEEVPTGYVMGEGNSGDKDISISSLSDPSPVMSESPPPRVERVVDQLEPLGVALN